VNQPSHPANIAQLIVDAMHDGQKLTEIRPEHVPADAAAAYALQREILRLRDTTVGGWKVGSKSTSGGPINGALLPEDACLPVAARLNASTTRRRFWNWKSPSA
jgi:2-keto-4-pentenoate hydratase